MSWFITHRYYIKSLKIQEDEATKQIKELTDSLNKLSSNDAALLKNTYIEGAVEAWKKKGQAVDYLNSINDISDKMKYEIFRSACLRHNHREPKYNPFEKSE